MQTIMKQMATATLVLLAVACGTGNGNSNLEKKKAELQELKTTLKKKTEKIAAMEKKINLMEPSSKP